MPVGTINTTELNDRYFCLYLRAMEKLKIKEVHIAVHIVFWTLIALLPFVFPGAQSRLKIDFIFSWGVSLIMCLVVFYTYYGCVIKRFLKQESLLKFVAISIFVYTILLIVELFVNYLEHLIVDKSNMFHPTSVVTRSLFSNAFIIGVALFVSLIENWFRMQKYQQEVERERLESELKMLRFQVNPHFLFNTLNNIHTLVYKKSDDAPSAVMKLAGLMRYMLYESDSEFTPLAKELEYIHNFVELQKLRLPYPNKVNLYIAGDPNNKQIAPLLLIPFIENAFKHGAASSNETFIDIKLIIAGNSINFVCKNTYKRGVESPVHSGIGLKNVKKRLNIQYPQRHSLDIEKDDRFFTVNLQLST